MKKAFFVVLASVCVFTACKKDENTTAQKKEEKTTSDKMLGKWQFVSDLWLQNYKGAINVDSTYGKNGQTVEFRNDGKFYVDFGVDDRDTSSYKVIDDSHFILDYGTEKDTMQINRLTDSSFVFYNKTITSTGYTEETVTLKK